MKNRPFSQRIGFALSGLREGWRRERSFRIQTRIGVLAGVALVILRPASVWWAAVGLVIVMVLAVELINAALEALMDHLHPAAHPEIRIVKDMAAASVLLGEHRRRDRGSAAARGAALGDLIKLGHYRTAALLDNSANYTI